jgi:uncharacterized protein YegL
MCVSGGESVPLDAGSDHSSYLWNDNSGQQTLIANSAGTYSVEVENDFGCKSSDEITIFSENTQSMILPAQVCFEPSQSITLEGPEGFERYFWNRFPPVFKRSLSVSKVGSYTLSATDACGVTQTATTEVEVCDAHGKTVLVMDRSGSMAGLNKMTLAKEASVLFLDAMYDADPLQNEIGLVSYSNTVSSDVELDVVNTNYNAVKSGINSLTPDGSTSIGGGLREGVNMFDYRGPKFGKECMLLLTDGIQNKAPSPADVYADVQNRGIDEIHTLAMGDNADVDILSNIAVNYGQNQGLFYHIPSTGGVDRVLFLGRFNNIVNRCMENNGVSTNSIILPPGGVIQQAFDIDENSDRAFVSVIWGGSNAPQFKIRNPEGVWTDETSAGRVFYSDADNYKRYRLEIEPDDVGEWMVELGNTHLVEELELSLSIYSDDPSLTIKVTTDKSIYNSPEEMKLVANLRYDTEAALGVEVKGTIRSPHGSSQSVILNDAGVNGDDIAGDGLYTVVFGDFDGSGTHSVHIQMDNASGSTPGGIVIPSFSRMLEFDVIARGYERLPTFVNPYNLKVYAKWLSNHSQGSAVRYFISNDGGYTLSDIYGKYFFSTAEVSSNNAVMVDSWTPQSGLSLDEENGEWVVQMDLDGTTLNPGDVTAWGFAGGEDFSLHLQGWSTNWDVSNDYSAQGLTSSWSMTKYINLYDYDGNLIYGTPRNGGALNVAPVASISGPASLAAPGVIALDGSGSSDPDAGPSALTWQWYLDGSVMPGMVSPQLNHNLTAEGVYEFRLVVSDGDKSSESTHSVQVGSPGCSAANAIDLGSAGRNTVITVDGEECLLLKGSNVSFWQRSLTVQFSPADHRAMSGEASLGDQALQSLIGWNINLWSPAPGSGEDTVIRVKTTESRSFRVVWW